MHAPPAEIFRALGDPTRCRIVELLGQAPRSVSELVSEFSMSQPAVSKHLRVLREAEVVRVQSQGRQRIYALAPQPLDDAERWLEAASKAWEDRLARLKAHIEGEEEA
ncbi:MAG TPA: metalloregulator ArsR/SmtB family transcription factor [Longimicrobiales bacterium]|jgi:DNA-binding transcriptional ArsR family regulator